MATSRFCSSRVWTSSPAMGWARYAASAHHKPPHKSQSARSAQLHPKAASLALIRRSSQRRLPSSYRAGRQGAALARWKAADVSCRLKRSKKCAFPCASKGMGESAVGIAQQGIVKIKQDRFNHRAVPMPVGKCPSPDDHPDSRHRGRLFRRFSGKSPRPRRGEPIQKPSLYREN